MIEAFARCPVPGCVINVWGPTGAETRCKAHGGNRLDFPEVAESDEWGEPITPTAAAGFPPSWPPATPSEAQ